MAIAGVVFRREIVQQRILEQVISVIGSSGADVIRTMLASAQSQKAGVAGFVVLLFSASALFNALRKARNQIWGVKPDQSSTWWEVIKDQMISLSMVVGIGCLLLASVLAGSAFGPLALSTFLQPLSKLLGMSLRSLA